MPNVWPLQSEMDAYYGNPRGKPGEPNPTWEVANIVRITPPFRMTYAGQPAKSIRVHKKCADSLLKCLTNLWNASAHDQAMLDHSGASIYGGAYNFRLMRGGNELSIHSWGAAIDLDPVRNAFHDTSPNFLNYPMVIKAFEDEGATWGGRWLGQSCDGMHFQFARVK